MLQFVCYIMPAFISLSIHKKITKETNNTNLIMRYGIYCTLINLLTLFVAVIRHLKDPYTFNMITVTFCFKYLAIATLFAFIMPYVVKIIIKNVEIDVEVKKNEIKKKGN